MITFTKGDLFESHADALVNTSCLKVSTGTGTRNTFQELGKSVVFATNPPGGAKRMRYMRMRKARFAMSVMIMNAMK